MYSGGKLGIRTCSEGELCTDLSVRLSRQFICLPEPPTPSEDMVSFCDLLYCSTVGKWRLIGRLTRVKIALASD